MIYGPQARIRRRRSLCIGMERDWPQVGCVPGKTLSCRDLHSCLEGVLGMCGEHTGCLLNEHQCQLLPLHCGGGFIYAPPRHAHECSPRGSERQLETGKPR